MSVVKLKGMPSYEMFGRFYDAVMGDGSESAKRVSELVRVSKPDARKVLELGCGTGTEEGQTKSSPQTDLLSP
jgi:hypothetical protein